jgi:hypothetical protein
MLFLQDGPAPSTWTAERATLQKEAALRQASKACPTVPGVRLMPASRTIALLIGAACLVTCAAGPGPSQTPAPIAAAGKLTIAGAAFGPAEIVAAKVVFTPSGAPAIEVEFTPEGRSRFSGLTAGLVGQALPIVLDGELLSAPLLNEVIDSQTIQIAGSFSVEEAMTLARRIGDGRP